MAVLATDTFDGADGSLGANWTQYGDGQIGVTSHVATTRAGTTPAGAAVYTATSAPADQYAKCVVVTAVVAPDTGGGPAVRLSVDGGSWAGYFVQGGNSDTRLYKHTAANGYQQIGNTAAAIADGDLLELQIVGTALTVLKNGSPIDFGSGSTTTDATIASGQFGFWIAAAGAPGDTGIDNWEGGNFAGGGLGPNDLRVAMSEPGLGWRTW